VCCQIELWLLHREKDSFRENNPMKKVVDEVVYDAKFVQEHTLQPGWFKVLKIIILIGVIVGYIYFWGWAKTAVFFTTFFLLALILHFTYHIKTKKYTQSWLDFKVKEENGKLVYERIGIYYYSAVVLFAVISFAVSQMLPVK